MFAYLDKWYKVHGFGGQGKKVKPVDLIFVFDGMIDPCKGARFGSYSPTLTLTLTQPYSVQECHSQPATDRVEEVEATPKKKKRCC